MNSYRQVLANRATRNVLLLGGLVRIPFFAQSVLLALHVVQTLHGSYAQAGLATACVTLCVAAAGPWRGRLLDRFGLRRTIAPSIVVGAACWAVAPFLGYLPLLALAGLAGLFEIPIFSVVRQAVIASTGEEDRRGALALDAVAVEVSYMIGPAAGIAATAVLPTRAVLLAAQMCLVLGGVVLWLVNPRLRGDPAAEPEPVARREWFRLEFVALCVGSCASIAVLSAQDLTMVAAMRHFHAQPWLGPVLALWAGSSLVGGLIYGSLRRPVSPYLLLAGLGVSALACVAAGGPVAMGFAVVVAGLCCAPSQTAFVDELSRIVPEGGRGEAFGWYTAAVTAGTAVGTSLGGPVIDAAGYRGGFLLSAALGAGLGLVLFLLITIRSRLAGTGDRFAGHVLIERSTLGRPRNQAGQQVGKAGKT